MRFARTVLPELLDQLAPDDPLARHSRIDLQKIHLVMGTLHSMRSAIRDLGLRHPPRRILELGAGDGTLLLRLARVQSALWPKVELTLLDQHDLVSRQTLDAYAALGWRVSVLSTEVIQWVRGSSPRYDLCLTSLFLHHFAEQDLAAILAAVAARSAAFVACEPRRNGWSRVASRLVGVLGANSVTRSDAVSSVAAGFADRELSAAWPADGSWIVDERLALPFTHRFWARSGSVAAGAAT